MKAILLTDSFLLYTASCSKRSYSLLSFLKMILHSDRKTSLELSLSKSKRIRRSILEKIPLYDADSVGEDLHLMHDWTNNDYLMLINSPHLWERKVAKTLFFPKIRVKCCNQGLVVYHNNKWIPWQDKYNWALVQTRKSAFPAWVCMWFNEFWRTGKVLERNALQSSVKSWSVLVLSCNWTGLFPQAFLGKE